VENVTGNSNSIAEDIFRLDDLLNKKAPSLEGAFGDGPWLI
jgi:hypothetical protein